jgi:hypothetical protein
MLEKAVRPCVASRALHPFAFQIVPASGRKPPMIDKLEFIIALAREEHFSRAAEVAPDGRVALCRMSRFSFSPTASQQL